MVMPRRLSQEYVQEFCAKAGEAAAALYANGSECATAMREIARTLSTKIRPIPNPKWSTE